MLLLPANLKWNGILISIQLEISSGIACHLTQYRHSNGLGLFKYYLFGEDLSDFLVLKYDAFWHKIGYKIGVVTYWNVGLHVHVLTELVLNVRCV